MLTCVRTQIKLESSHENRVACDCELKINLRTFENFLKSIHMVRQIFRQVSFLRLKLRHLDCGKSVPKNMKEVELRKHCWKNKEEIDSLKMFINLSEIALITSKS